jgi:hypothetical protein
MSRLFLLSDRHMARISPYFPLSHEVPRVDDRRVIRQQLFPGRPRQERLLALHSFHQKPKNPAARTTRSPSSATGSRTCSASSRIAGVSPLAMIVAPTPSCRPSVPTRGSSCLQLHKHLRKKTPFFISFRRSHFYIYAVDQQHTRSQHGLPPCPLGTASFCVNFYFDGVLWHLLPRCCSAFRLAIGRAAPFSLSAIWRCKACPRLGLNTKFSRHCRALGWRHSYHLRHSGQLSRK